MIIAISGSSGLIGNALRSHLRHEGHRVRAIVRHQPGQEAGRDDIRWDIDAGKIEADKLEKVDAVIHLAGEPIADGKWTNAKKQHIRDSRVNSTALLSKAIAKMPLPPHVLLSGSAVGYYGSQGDQRLGEDAPEGEGFLASVCSEWEAATLPAQKAGVRVAHLRTGIVLDKAGGALAKMMTPFKLGLGGRIGPGTQYMPWISLADQISAIDFCLNSESMRGPVNLVGPHPVTNAQFTTTLGMVLHRPTFLPLPAFAARMMFGEMADEMLLASARVEPTKLLNAGFRFSHNDLEGAIRAALKK